MCVCKAAGPHKGCVQNSRSKSPHTVQVLVLSRCLCTAKMADVLLMSSTLGIMASWCPLAICNIQEVWWWELKGFALCRGLLGDSSSSSSSDEEEHDSGAAVVSDEVWPPIVSSMPA